MKITVQNISKAFGARDLLKDFSLDISSGVRLCVAGANGTGKSTFLRLLAGLEPLDSGRVLIPKGSRIGYVEQNLQDDVLDIPLLTWVLDVLPDWREFWLAWEEAIEQDDSQALQRLSNKQAEIEGIYGYNPEHKAQAILSGLGFDEKALYRPLRTLSGGWRERAKLARVLVAGADIVFLDEPTNHLDIEAVEWLEDYLLSYEGLLVFVAHDRLFMDKVASHVLYLGGSKPFYRKASFSQIMAQLAEIEEQRQKEAQRLNDDLAHKLDFVRRFGAKATKARQANARKKQADKLIKELDTLKPEPKRKVLNFAWPKAPPSDKTVLSVADLAFSFPDGTSLWPPLTFTIFSGQRIAIVGPNGSGKSTLLKILAGASTRSGGSLVFGTMARIGYYSQHQTDILRTNASVLAEMRRLADSRTTEEELMSVLGLFMLGQGHFERTVGSLSGGERARLMLATLFIGRYNVLLLDEPTNHLDLESREALTEALANFNGTVIIIAHDRHVLRQVAEEAWLVNDKGIEVFPHGFDDYDKARRAQLKEITQGDSLAKDPSASLEAANNLSREESRKQKREEAERRNKLYTLMKPKQERYAKLEKTLTELLDEQGQLEKELADPDIFSDKDLTQGLLDRFATVKDEADTVLIEMAEIEEFLQELEDESL